MEFVRPAQNQAKLDHVGGIRYAVVGAVFHGTEKQRAIFFVAKHDDRRVKGYVADLIHEPKARIEITLRACRSEVQQYYVAPLPQVIKPLKLEFVDPACRKTVTQGPRNHFR